MIKIKKVKRLLVISVILSIVLQHTYFASYDPRNPYNMYWKAYGDGTFAWIPQEDERSVVKQGAWYQYDDGRWAFYMSTDGGNVFTPLKSCTAFINFNDNPNYNLYTFDINGILVGAEYRNLEFPPQGMLYVNIYAKFLQLKLQPGGICVVDGTVLNGHSNGPFLR